MDRGVARLAYWIRENLTTGGEGAGQGTTRRWTWTRRRATNTPSRLPSFLHVPFQWLALAGWNRSEVNDSHVGSRLLAAVAHKIPAQGPRVPASTASRASAMEQCRFRVPVIVGFDGEAVRCGTLPHADAMLMLPPFTAAQH
ncbi:hypothetical protein CMUS01_04923 [Colletotrichum musicola]|uniref:Uncharacterized protein n=1 Tax=Colletotrichum musicola TaxID=2175873 RepID=A0A8H6NL66_9PEZI|nr:hypothetical protein CMUS01_04923 [Colletotrichum musicola]